MDTLSVQIVSDLHPKYSDLDIPVTTPYIAFLGNVHQVKDNHYLHLELKIFPFFETYLRRYKVVFLVLGVRETQYIKYDAAVEQIRAFEARINEQPGLGKFVFLDQKIYDISPDTTVLGFGNTYRSIDDYNAAHESDLAWLNQQVAHMAEHEPH
ncbi:uncharacterized protein KD926_006320 [Aspergillus affinis]|uniref:uncharacterized protein n=1 Tax=Aspergillus affinis TaxID=1070780 RepID=UPI0022FDF509|nr:uncharacterized protein KD926_006320 [Aspergillus affinis]KAI9041983.1 hypothetical protein KD926_006320 [Aspergillus affinis]